MTAPLIARAMAALVLAAFLLWSDARGRRAGVRPWAFAWIAYGAYAAAVAAGWVRPRAWNGPVAGAALLAHATLVMAGAIDLLRPSRTDGRVLLAAAAGAAALGGLSVYLPYPSAVMAGFAAAAYLLAAGVSRHAWTGVGGPGILAALGFALMAGEQGATALGLGGPLLAGAGMGALLLAGLAPLAAALEEERLRTTQALAEAQRLEFHDTSTDLPNRRLLLDRVEQALAAARRTGTRVAVAHLDVDRFSVVNHAWSPAVGDAVLRGVGDRLRALIRDGDVLARLHGDSFGFLLTGLRTDEQVNAFAERVARRLGRPFALHGREIELTASIGVSWYPDHGADGETLLRHADAAMYRAKEAGRNRTVLYRPTMNTRVAERLAMEQGLRRAIGSNELRLFFQPIVEIPSGRIVRFEALIRWEHPERGLLPPDQFLPLAEPIGLADAIDQWVLRTACTEALRWRSLLPAHAPRVAVNLTSRSFQQPDLIQRIDTVLGDTGLPASALELEITESTAMGDAEATLVVMRQLKAAGVRLAIDDFGTGYSSLSYLRTFPIDTLKIDRAFVRDLGREPTAPALIAGIVALSRSLGLEVVAEGIETEEQRAIVEAEGCRLLQGYLLGRPLPASECTALMTAPLAPAVGE